MKIDFKSKEVYKYILTMIGHEGMVSGKRDFRNDMLLERAECVMAYKK
jgi:hypothetical protein